MNTGKDRAPDTPDTAPLDRAVADLRDIAAEFRAELDLVRAERRAHAELVADRDRLVGEVHQSQRAVLLLIDRELRAVSGAAFAPAGSGTHPHPATDGGGPA